MGSHSSGGRILNQRQGELQVDERHKACDRLEDYETSQNQIYLNRKANVSRHVSHYHYQALPISPLQSDPDYRRKSIFTK
jgi:hypothetical protein